MKKMLVPVLVCSLVLTVSGIFAQEKSSPTAARLALESAEQSRPVMRDLTLSKKIGARLPNGYKDVVNDEQRKEIYKVHREYGEILERLKMRVELLEMERAERIDALLTEEQTQKLKQSGDLQSEKQRIKREHAAKLAQHRPGKAADEEKPANEPAK